MEADPLSQSTEPRPALSSRGSVLSAAVAIVAGGLLRIWMLRKFFEVNGDSQIYGGMAKNLLLHGQYAVADGNGVLHSTLIRLPGYPLFLAACFRLLGMENYFAAACVQIVLDLIGCALLALFAWRLSPPALGVRSAHATLWLAALCPFIAIYAAEPLTEAPTLFAIALALWALARFQDTGGRGSALAFTFAVTYAALLRPDGALVGLALSLPMLFAPMRWIEPVAKEHGRPVFIDVELLYPHLRKVIVCLLLALTPFTVWSIRNWSVFHVFEPLAPRYATDPGEDTWPGWQRWVKTWCLDFVSTSQIYWNMPGAPLDIKQLPSRATDSPAQYTATAKLMADYEANGEEMSPELDARFGQLADTRIAAHPLRSHLLLPLGRMADMWVRPRVENLPIDPDWWVYKHHHVETRFTWLYAGLNALYLLLGLAGLLLRPRLWPWMLLFIVLRSALLCTIEAPEARYTIECFPMLFVLGGIALGRLFAPRPTSLRTI
jgi:hypothetical protein